MVQQKHSSMTNNNNNGNPDVDMESLEEMLRKVFLLTNYNNSNKSFE